MFVILTKGKSLIWSILITVIMNKLFLCTDDIKSELSETQFTVFVSLY